MSSTRIGLIFDLDGTLIDSTTDITRAVNAVFKARDLSSVSTDDVRDAIEHDGETLLRRLIPESYPHKNLPDLLDQFRDEYDKLCTHHINPYEGIPELVTSLERYSSAIVTNKPQSMTEAILDEVGWLDTFDPILGADHQEKLKPSPLPLQSVRRHWSQDHTPSVIVGDTWSDIEAGNKANFVTVGCGYGLGNLADTNPDHVVSSPEQIKDVLHEIEEQAHLKQQ